MRDFFSRSPLLNSPFMRNTIVFDVCERERERDVHGNQGERKVCLRPGVNAETEKRSGFGINQFCMNKSCYWYFGKRFLWKLNEDPESLQCPGSPGNIRSSGKLKKQKFLDIRTLQKLFSKVIHQTARWVKCNSPQEQEQEQEQEQKALLEQEFHSG